MGSRSFFFGLLAMPNKTYFYAIGKFMHSYTRTENMIHLMFAPLTGLNEYVAMAIKGATRVSDVMAMIRRIVIINEMPKEFREDLESAFTQFDQISQFRDRVIHRGANPAGQPGEYISTNVATMRAFNLLEIAEFKIGDIRAATTDLERIWYELIRVAKRLPKITNPRHRGYRKYLVGPWRYKFVRPKTAATRFQPKPQARQPQLRPLLG